MSHAHTSARVLLAPVAPAPVDPDPGERVRRALAAADPATEVIVDFDETLWLRNSTEEYLRSLRPRPLAYLILAGLDVLRPWRLIGGASRQHLYRDWLRILVCSILLPWSLLLWRSRAPALAERWRNGDLLKALHDSGRTSFRVATLGTHAIVAPLLRHLAPQADLVASGTLLSGYEIRRLGKCASIARRHGRDLVCGAIVITDSDADADLLGGCATPLLIRWPAAEYRPAFAEAYVPFRYTQQGKRPGENYMLYGVLLEDVVLLWLSFAWIMPAPIAGAAALLALHLSLWCIYEIGYVENDTRAASHEATPQLWGGAGAASARHFRPAWAWTAAAAFAVLGAGLLVTFNAEAVRLPFGDGPVAVLLAGVLGVWAVYLVLTRLVFAIYNRLDVTSRGIFYVVLQLLRTVGYGVLLATNVVGLAALLSLVLARWIKYLVYRDTGRRMAEDQRFLALLFFVVLAGTAASIDLAAFVSLQALAVLAWLAVYAHRRIRGFFARLRIVPL
ncbi:hypothetical protein CCR97_02100 [Rhodoplanes elegans]|uniref:Haloacid dehalogenase-like hydrolase n=1 Tax=Rhodoplanes elegans TaxID=29408 RepID=A0A327KGJ2_9BRAD|nr:hypothetical protein [Rhodoplanes elegans]MBK5957011.1 hypothetical protein [Rhodoplanes elegans]RAI36763.1 hypothetical protein CH338_17110 [Rhodoplanes elegans]